MQKKLFDNPTVEREWPSSMSEEAIVQCGFGLTGDQRIYRFPNGFGASLVKICMVRDNKNEVMPFTGLHPVTDEPLWELGIVYFNSDDDTDYTITFETSVSDDVIRRVTDSRAELILRQIKELSSVPATRSHT